MAFPASSDDNAAVAKRTPDKTVPRSVSPSAPKHGLAKAIRGHPYWSGAAALLILLVAAAVVVWWLNARHFESTDDAFIDARTVAIGAQVNGAIVNVPVTDNQLVQAGAILVEIDPRDYEAALQRAQAQVAQAMAAIATADAQIAAQEARIDQAEKQVTQAQAALTFAEAEARRARDLLTRGAGTEQQAQQTESTRRQDQAALDQAQANLNAARKQIAVLQAQRQTANGQLDQANAQLAQARTNLERTQVRAPVEGRAAKISAAVGGTAQVGAALMMFVPEQMWVTANFKETQLTNMRPGQPVDISIDAYPGHVFKGHVDSLQPGSGAAFSLLPPENATGNYVKVVQRVPVKIVFDNMPDLPLGPGMSVVPTVKVR
jgi:membrane fusion protein (multidrug efflux system)